MLAWTMCLLLFALVACRHGEAPLDQSTESLKQLIGHAKVTNGHPLLQMLGPINNQEEDASMLTLLGASGLIREEDGDVEDKDQVQEQELHWVTTYFDPPNRMRRNQLSCALLRNLQNLRIKQVHVLTENMHFNKSLLIDEGIVHWCPMASSVVNRTLSEIAGDKLNIVRCGAQPTYYTFASWISNNLHGRLVAISNADIYLGKLPECISAATMARRAFSLSRKQSPDCKKKPHEGNLCRRSIGSADVHILVPPLQNSTLETMMTVHGGIPQNRYGAENVFEQLLKDDGFEVLDPCKSIDMFHMHCGTPSSAPDKRIGDKSSIGILYKASRSLRCTQNGSFRIL